MYQQEKEFRAALAYPPFGRLINIRFSGKQEDAVRTTAKAAASFLRSRMTGMTAQKTTGSNAEILGPAPAPLSMIKQRFRWQLLLKGDRPELLHQLCDLLSEEKKNICGQGVRMSIDVDPENMM